MKFQTTFGRRLRLAARAGIAVAIALVSSIATAATISFTDVVGAPGDEVTSLIEITDVTDLDAGRLDSINLTLTYDTSLLSFLGAQNGAVLEAASPPDATESPAGTVALGFLAKTGGVTVSAGSVLGSLSFKVLNDAPAGIQAGGLALGDIQILSDVTDVFPANAEADVQVVPLPPVLVLFLTAMASAASFGRLRRRA